MNAILGHVISNVFQCDVQMLTNSTLCARQIKFLHCSLTGRWTQAAAEATREKDKILCMALHARTLLDLFLATTEGRSNKSIQLATPMDIARRNCTGPLQHQYL